MRFFQDGPSIPDELLNARDADEVLFFCGAGVSQADASLPNFTVLAENVLELLGSALDSPARKLFDAGRHFEKETGLTGLVATDRIFGMLEREFEPREVQEAVARALKPQLDYSLDAHRTILDLSRTRAGVARLVTTNFDLLFEQCEPGIDSFNPPQLPDPRRDRDFRGVIHLHGRVDSAYSRACDDEFVLSSADFGHAYLSDGWATRYIQELLRRFRIVFVGYSADDPPVQYLLEAFNRFEKNSHKLYAFQSGDATQAIAQWAHKGVEPIAYNSANGHAALWRTLSAWAERARDVGGWYDRLITSAVKGPALMKPHERGMVAHLTSTVTGARLLSSAKVPLPANWLCVFDRDARYAPPHKIGLYDLASSSFDPFEVFGLDSDMPPAPVDPDQIYSKRAVPENAWSGILLLPIDCHNLLSEGVAKLSGFHADVAADLPPRLSHLGFWFVKISHQPAALWWAAKQLRLHPVVQQRIEWALRQNADLYTSAVRDGWRVLLASWRQKLVDRDACRYEIENKAHLEGWSPSFVREVIELYHPVINVEPIGTLAPEEKPELLLTDILRVDVGYPRPHETLELPPGLLGYGVALFRNKLEYAVQIEREVNQHERIYFDTTRPDDGETLDEDAYGLTGHLAIFTNMVTKLAVTDLTAARKEIAQWSALNDPVFTRLRIWAAGRSDLKTPEEAGQVFLELDDITFWATSQERDLLFSIRDRWSEMPLSITVKIEARIREGVILDISKYSDYEKRVAYYRLCRLHWLSAQGVTFSFDLDSECAELRKLAQDWTEGSLSFTARPSVSKIYNIVTDTDAAPLETLRLSEVLEEARALGEYSLASHVQRRPFSGLAADRPIRALSVLTDAARKDKFEPWAWSAFLSAGSNRDNSKRLVAIIGHRLARLKTSDLVEIVHPASAWLNEYGEVLFKEAPNVFNLVWDAMVVALMSVTKVKQYSGHDRAWVEEALNSPVRNMIYAMAKDPAIEKFCPSTSLSDGWLFRLAQLLNLPGDQRLHAIVLITKYLNWLFRIDPDWTKLQLLSLADATSDDAKAFWSGYFCRVQKTQCELYLLLKPGFIKLACQIDQRRNYTVNLAVALLEGWAGGGAETERLISDIELREILIHAEDELRTKMLWHLERRVLEAGGHWHERLIPFLIQVWPRQRDVRTVLVSGRLVELALNVPSRFPEIVDAILPRLTQSSGASLRIRPYIASSSSNTIVKLYPEKFLELLWAILSEDRGEWPYGIERFFIELSEQDATRGDPRLSELVRREQRR